MAERGFGNDDDERFKIKKRQLARRSAREEFLKIKEQREAEARARELAQKESILEAEARGADPVTIEVELDIEEKTFDAEFGSVYIGYYATATASGNLKLCKAAE